jgi:hypothetical protein
MGSVSSIFPLIDCVLNIQSSSISTIKLLKTSEKSLLYLRSQVGTILPLFNSCLHRLGTSGKQQHGLWIELDTDVNW